MKKSDKEETFDNLNSRIDNDKEEIIDELDYQGIVIDEKYFSKYDDGNDIVSIFGKEALEEIQNVISEVTGLAFVTVDYRGEPLTEMTHFTRFCRRVREDPSRNLKCKLSDASGAIRAAVTKKTSHYFCPCGLLEVAIPIVVNGRFLGGFIGGQVRCIDAPKNVDYITENDTSSINRKDEEWLEIKEYGYKEFEAISKLVELIVGQLTKQQIITSHYNKKNIRKIQSLKKKINTLEFENKILNDKLDEFNRNFNDSYRKSVFGLLSNLSIIEGATNTNEVLRLYYKYLENHYKFTNVNSLEFILEQTKILLDIAKYGCNNEVSYSINYGNIDIKSTDMLSGFIQTYTLAIIFFEDKIVDEPINIDIAIALNDGLVEVKIKNNGSGLPYSTLYKKYKQQEDIDKIFDNYNIINDINYLERKVKSVGNKECYIEELCEEDNYRCVTLRYLLVDRKDK